jgi:hypothetical protein
VIDEEFDDNTLFKVLQLLVQLEPEVPVGLVMLLDAL